MHDSITELLKTSTVTEKRQQHPPVLACLPRLLKRMISPTQLVKEVCIFKMSINFDKMLKCYNFIDKQWYVLFCFKWWQELFSYNCIYLCQVLAAQEMHSATQASTEKGALKLTLGIQISTQRSTISRTIENWRMFTRRFRKESPIKDLKIRVNKS